MWEDRKLERQIARSLRVRVEWLKFFAKRLDR